MFSIIVCHIDVHMRTAYYLCACKEPTKVALMFMARDFCDKVKMQSTDACQPRVVRTSPVILVP